MGFCDYAVTNRSKNNDEKSHRINTNLKEVVSGNRPEVNFCAKVKLL